MEKRNEKMKKAICLLTALVCLCLVCCTGAPSGREEDTAKQPIEKQEDVSIPLTFSLTFEELCARFADSGFTYTSGTVDGTDVGYCYRDGTLKKETDENMSLALTVRTYDGNVFFVNLTEDPSARESCLTDVAVTVLGTVYPMAPDYVVTETAVTGGGNKLCDYGNLRFSYFESEDALEAEFICLKLEDIE